MRFQFVPKSMTLDDLEQPKRHSCRNSGADQKIFNTVSEAKCGPI